MGIPGTLVDDRVRETMKFMADDAPPPDFYVAFNWGIHCSRILSTTEPSGKIEDLFQIEKIERITEINGMRLTSHSVVGYTLRQAPTQFDFVTFQAPNDRIATAFVVLLNRSGKWERFNRHAEYKQSELLLYRPMHVRGGLDSSIFGYGTYHAPVTTPEGFVNPIFLGPWVDGWTDYPSITKGIICNPRLNVHVESAMKTLIVEFDTIVNTCLASVERCLTVHQRRKSDRLFGPRTKHDVIAEWQEHQLSVRDRKPNAGYFMIGEEMSFPVDVYDYLLKLKQEAE